jgi:Zn-dependent protease with chaperone function
LWDWTKGELITLILGTLVIWLFYFIVHKSPVRWWLYFWLISLPLIVLLIFVKPVVIDPMFNHFEPLEAKQPQLVPEIQKVVTRGGHDIPRNRMFEMRASDKVTTLNAYVTGVGASKQVVVWDNTAREMTTAQTLFVFGHEQGHYVLHHMWKGIAFFAALLLVLLYLGYRTIGWLVARYGNRWDVRSVGDWASFPLLLLLFSLFGFFVQPITSGFSRWMEHDADIYGLEITHGINADSSQAAAQAFQALGEKGLVYPNPSDLEIFWAYGHPANRDRVQFALQYRPWDEGKPTKFVKP